MANTNPIQQFVDKQKTISPTGQKIGVVNNVNPIQQFVDKQKIDIPVKTPNESAFSASPSVSPFASSTITQNKTSTPDVIMKDSEKPTLWQKVSKQLMKPVGMVAAETEALGKYIGGKIAGVDSGEKYIPGKSAIDVLTGKKETSFSDVWRRHAPGAIGVSESTAGKIGFIFDITNDPLNFIGGGLTKAGKVASKVSSLSKAGKTVKEGSKLANQITKLGLKAEDLTLAATKAKQAEKGQRALLGLKWTPFSDISTPLIKGKKFYDVTSKTKDVVGLTKIGAMTREAFSTKSGVPELDDIVGKYKNLSNYRKSEIIENAVEIQKDLSKFKPDEFKKIVDAIENPRPTNEAIQLFSNNVDELNFQQAQQKLAGSEHKNFVKTALDINNKYGAKTIEAKSLLGDTISYGQENSVLNWIEATPETSKAIAAEKGLLGAEAGKNQFTVLNFDKNPIGKDILIKIEMPKNLTIDKIRSILNDRGLEFRSLDMNTNEVTIFDKNFKNKELITNLINDYDTKYTKFKGTGSFIGSDVSREEAAKVFRGIRSEWSRNRGLKGGRSYSDYRIPTQGAVRERGVAYVKPDKQTALIVDKINDFFDKIKTVETEAGVLKETIEDYFPHIKTKEAFGDRLKSLFNSKKYNATLGAAKERKILKVIKENGEEMLGDYTKMGLKRINKPALRNGLESATAKKTATLQKLLDTLSKDKINLYTGDLQEIISTLRKNISYEPKMIGTATDLINPTTKELDDIISSIVYPKRDELELLIKDLEKLVQTSQGKEFLKPVLGFKNSKNAKIKWAYDEIINTQNKLADSLKKIDAFDFVDKQGNFYKQGKTMVSEINEKFGKEFFELNPAVAYAQRGLASAKAVTAKEFLDEVGKKFFTMADEAPSGFVESQNKLLEGLKAPPEVVKVVDQYVEGIKPEELKLIVKAFDGVQNWWKAQALLSPQYHIRNMVSNFWNNWMAGVNDPTVYYKARKVQAGKNMDEVILVTEAGEKLTVKQIRNLANKEGVVGGGWYSSDIAQTLKQEMGDIPVWKKFNPLSQDNMFFRKNREVGSLIEDNARVALFMNELKKGFSATDAAKTVKKFLFDYQDLSKFEKGFMKRVVPFYTWTRKNIPLQLENLLVQPAKYAMIPKAIKEIESGVPAPSSEKYMSEYLSENIPVRIRKNPKGNYEYFLIGNWIPSAQAIDFLSQPIYGMLGMLSPFIKTPFEFYFNKSTFFKNTLGEPTDIEYYYKEPTTFVEFTMRKKTASLLRNIRVLSDLDKYLKIVDPKSADKSAPEDSLVVQTLNVLFGKAQTYDISKSRYFYQRDTDDRISELERSIKNARKKGDKEYAKKIIEEIKEFRKKRGR